MKIIFFGTSEFAKPALEVLMRSRHDIALVITQPQKQKGRGLKLSLDPVEELAKSHHLKTFNPENVNSAEAVAILKNENADIFVIVSYGRILSDEVLSIPKLYPVNIHASLLPEYRGASPMQRSIIDGRKKTGVTIMIVTKKLDSGDIVKQADTEISDSDNAQTLSRRLSVMGAEALLTALDEIEFQKVIFIKQDESKASYAGKLTKEDGKIDWSKDALAIRNLIRGCFVWPSAFTYLDGKLLKILEADISTATQSSKSGTIISVDDNGIGVSCGKDSLLIKKLQLEGKKPLSAAAFLRGKRLTPGIILL